MSHAMYTALSGAVAQERALEVVADNLANVSTTGFKGTRLTFREVLTDADGRPSISQAEVQAQQEMARARAMAAAGAQGGAAAAKAAGAEPVGANAGADGQAHAASGPPHVQVEVAGAYVDMSTGPLKTTNRPLDFALTGAGFFSVQTPAGERFTRQGSFVLAADGSLVTLQGHPVQGASGNPIRMNPQSEVQADNTGAIFADGAYVDSLRRVNVATSKDLQREGNALYSVREGARVDEVQTSLQGGALEQSNVNAVSAMTQLIGVQRAHESYHRALETIRGLEQKTSSELG
jgi:flagellar basal-body rod protein FlgF